MGTTSTYSQHLTFASEEVSVGLRDLNIDLTREHVAFWNESRKFFSEVWRPAAVELDRLANPEDVIAEGSLLWDVLSKTYELGYHTVMFPEEIGGTGADPLTYALMAELMGWAASDLAISFMCCRIPFTWARLSPDPELQELAKSFCQDREARLTGCWAITESDHGSDSLRFEGKYCEMPELANHVRATPDGDDYVINGQKSAWVSNGSFATHAALWLSIDPSRGNEGGGIALVPLDLPGISRGKPLNKLGQRALNQGEIFFDDVRIPKKMMIASDPATFKLFSNIGLGGANASIGLVFTGCAQAAFEEALAYAKERVQGGKVIYDHQNIKLRLSDMFVSIEAARSLARRAWIYNLNQFAQKEPMAVHYSMASKILATETAFRAASTGIQIMGGYGLSKEYHMEKIFRDARAAMIEDGTNDTLAIDAIERLGAGKLTLTVKEGTVRTVPRAEAAAATFDELKPMLRPEGVHRGLMRVDADKCTQCGLCLLNCPFKCFEPDENEIPRMKEGHVCFSCFNCTVVCKPDAISIEQVYRTDEGSFFSTDPNPAIRMPLEPKDADGKPDEWNLVERTILERRSVRNFKDKAVPEPIIHRILEAGRFAPSAGNNQNWKFVVVTDKEMINQMEEAVHAIVSSMNNAYTTDSTVMGLVQGLEQPFPEGMFEPRVWGGAKCVADKELPIFMGAPAVIFLAGSDRMVDPELHAGIAGQNMNLVAQSLGIGLCWSGFGAMVAKIDKLKEKLGIREPWRIVTSMVLGYPKFEQKGMVPRQSRPITWLKPGMAGPVVE